MKIHSHTVYEVIPRTCIPRRQQDFLRGNRAGISNNVNLPEAQVTLPDSQVHVYAPGSESSRFGEAHAPQHHADRVRVYEQITHFAVNMTNPHISEIDGSRSDSCRIRFIMKHKGAIEDVNVCKTNVDGFRTVGFAPAIQDPEIFSKVHNSGGVLHHPEIRFVDINPSEPVNTPAGPDLPDPHVKTFSSKEGVSPKVPEQYIIKYQFMPQRIRNTANTDLPACFF